MASAADLATFVTREEYDEHKGAVHRELGQVAGKVDELKGIIFEGMQELKRDLLGKLDDLGTEIEELKERSQVIELGRVKKENKKLQAELERREARGDKRTNWVMTFVISTATAAVSAFFSYLAARGH